MKMTLTHGPLYNKVTLEQITAYAKKRQLSDQNQDTITCTQCACAEGNSKKHERVAEEGGVGTYWQDIPKRRRES